MSTTEQIERFQRDGVLYLPRTLPTATALTLRDRLWAFLSTMHHRRQDDPTTWEPLEGRTRFKVLMRTDAFAELRRYLSEPITDVLGSAWDPPTYWGHPLVTFPDSRRGWAVPASGWHVDSTQWSVGELPGVVAFTFLDDVRPRGGGTLVIAGSHRVTWQLCQEAGGFVRTSEIKTTLARNDPWFADLWREPITGEDRLRRHFEDGTVVGDVRLRVVELCGRPGDVVLMNQRALHAAAPNALDTPRMMLADFITRRAEVAR